MSHRFAFRPEPIGPLDARVVPSTLVPGHPHHGAPMHRIVIPTPTITQSSPQWSRVRLPNHQFASPISANVVVRGADPAQVAGGVDPDLRTIEIHYENQGNAPVSSATITERLPRKLAYVAGSARAVDGGEFSATRGRNGVTVLRWSLPDAVPVASPSVVTFQARSDRT